MKKSIMIFLGICILIFMALTTKCAIDFADMRLEEQKKQIEQTKKEIEKLREKIRKSKLIICQHKVEKGESLYSIAQKYRVHQYQIRQWNDLKFGCVIHPNQRFVIKKVEWPAYVGKASWYGPGFHGKPMANTEIYNQDDVLIAHRHLPLGMRARITNLNNGRFIVALVLDRGPYAKDKNGKYTREIDLSLGAAKLLDAVEQGIIPVRIEPLPLI